MSQEISMDEGPKTVLEPFISKHGDVTLIGVNHTANPAEQKFKVSDLEACIGDSEHLYLEHNVHTFDLDREPRSYEEAAEQIFIKSGKEDGLHYFEEGTDKIALAEAYGLDGKTAFLADIVTALYDINVDNKINPATYSQEQLEKMIAIAGTYYPSIREYAKDEAIKKAALDFIATINDPSSKSYQDLYAPARSMQSYMMHIRDFEVITPQVKELEAIPGKKSIVVGANHRENIQTVLEGREMKKPLHWTTMLEYGFDKDERRRVDSFVDRAHGKQREAQFSFRRLQAPWKKNK